MKRVKMLSVLLSTAMILTSAAVPTYASDVLTAGGRDAIEAAELNEAEPAAVLDAYEESDADFAICDPEEPETEPAEAETADDVSLDAALAAESAEAEQPDGDGVQTGSLAYGGTWTLSGTSLTLDGTGAKDNKLGYRVNYDAYNNKLFDNEGITSVTITNFKILDTFCFCDWEDLTTVTLSEGLEEIGAGVFQRTSLNAITIPSTVTTICGNAFANTKLKTVDIPKNVKLVDGSAFYHCLDLETVTMHEGLETLGREVFYKCPKLKNIVVPDTVTKIDDLGISWNRFTDNEEDDPDITYYYSSLESVSLPISAEYQEADISDITLIIPYKCKKVIYTKGTGAWSSGINGFSGIIEDPRVRKNGGDANGDEMEGTQKFEVIFEEGVPSVPTLFAQWEEQLEKVTIPSTVTCIEKEAFEDCSGLKDVEFTAGTGSRTLTVDREAFARCENLKEIDFSKDINEFVFKNDVFWLSGLGDAYFRNPKAILDVTDEYGEALPFKEGTKLHAYSFEFKDNENHRYSVKSYVEKNSTYYKFVDLGKAPKPVPVKGLTVSPSSVLKYKDDITDGSVVELTAKVTPANADDTALSAETSDPDSVIRSVNCGPVVAKSGECRVTVTLTGNEGTAEVTVKTADGKYKAKSTVRVKGKDKAQTPYTEAVGGTSAGIGGQIAVRSMTGNAQIFYIIDDQDGESPTAWVDTLETDDSGKYVKTAETPDGVCEYKRNLVIGEDTSEAAHSLHAVALKAGLLPSAVLFAELPYEDTSVWGDISEEDVSSEFGGDIENFTAEYEKIWAPQSQRLSEGLIYTGKGVTIPGLRVYYGKKLLKLKTDYTVAYSDNVNVSTNAKVAITLKGNLSGKKTLDFTIRKSPVTAAGIGYSVIQVKALKSGDSYTAQTPDPKALVKATGVTLKAGTDYTIRYFRSTEGMPTFLDSVTEPGVYGFAIESFASEANYEIPLTDPETVILVRDAIYCLDPEKAAMSEASVSKIGTQNILNLIGSEGYVLPKFTVTYKNSTLKLDESGTDGHYTAEYDNAPAAGTSKIIIRGTGKEVDGLTFDGIKTVTFKVKGIALNKKKAKLTGVEKEYVYTGGPIEPACLVKYGETALVKDKDYSISYGKKGNVNVGKVSMTIKFKGMYTGSLKASFKIVPMVPDAAECVFNNNDEKWNDELAVFEHEKRGVKPAFVVKAGGKTLQSGKDYKVKYSNNKAAAAYNAKKGKKTVGPSFTIKFKGNYKGSATRYFNIEKASIADCDMTLTDLVASSSPNKYAQKPVIKDKNGSTLKAGKDYGKKYEYRYAEDVTVKVKSGKGKSAKTISVVRAEGEKVEKSDIIPVGAVIRVKVTGSGNYEDTIEDTFTVASKKAGSLKFEIDPEKTYYYTGKAITPREDAIKVLQKKGKKWVPMDNGSEYFEIIGYSNNVKKGKAKIMIRCTNGYAGTATVKFSIKAQGDL